MLKIWKALSVAARIILGILLAVIITLIILLIVRHNKNKNDDKDNSNSPEVAQVYEPSIGTPLPPDVKPEGSGTEVTATVENSGEVAGATTDEPFIAPGADTPDDYQARMVAPTTGVDPNSPVAYESDSLKFKATLPAGTQVSEQQDKIVFTNSAKTLYYQVSTNNAATETLQSIKAQLQNSPSVSNISQSVFGNTGVQSLNFSANGFGQGAVIIANGKIYYLLGNSKYFSTFKF